MKIATLTVNRPVFTTMMALIAVLVGLFALSRLPLDLMPDVTYPTLTVATNYENASPEEVEETITRRVEESVATVAGIEELTSVSSEGSSQVRVTFQWGVDLDVAANDIRDRLDRIVNALPEEADRPQLRKFDPASFPILIYGVASDLDPIALRSLIDEDLSYRIERIPGVATLDVWGGLERQIQIKVDPERIRALDLTLDQVRTALREANVTVPAGEVERGRLDVAVRTPGKFSTLEEIRNLTVARREGSQVRLGQIADVEDGHERISRLIRINEEPGVRIAVRKQAGSNTVDVADQVNAEMQRIQRDYPQLDLVPIVDQSEYIQNSVNNLTTTILYGGILAVFVLLVFLRNIRGTLVVAVAIPTSLIATFSLIYFGGFTLNLMTLGGLALGVGLMVDNAIVVLENISRVRKEEADDRSRAAVVGTSQVGPAIIASTITTLVIFAPLIFAQGMSGEMFSQLAYTVGFALICSLLVALTVVPMMASKILKDENGGSGRSLAKRMAAAMGRGFDAMELRYKELLELLLRHKPMTLSLAGLVFLLSLLLMPHIGAEFMPEADESEVRVSVEMEPGTRLEILDEVMKQVEDIVIPEVPEAESNYTRLGSSGWRGQGHTGEVRLSLVGVRDRDRSSAEIAADLRPLLEDIPGATIRTRAGQGLFLLRMGTGGGDGEQMEVEVRGFDLDRLDALSDDVEERLAGVEGISDTRRSREEGIPQELMLLNRDRAADLGVSMERAARTLEAAIGGVRAGEFTDEGREYDMFIRMRDSERLTQSQILNLTVRNDEGDQIALRNLVDVGEGVGPQQIDRKNQQRLAVVYANISGRDLGSVAADVQDVLRDIPMPDGYDAVVSGEFEEQQEAFSELGLAMIMAVLLVYMVLASLYESLRDPFIVMFTVPLAIIGVNVMLYLTGTTFNLQSLIGMIMLVGIVVNNSILIVDQTGRLQRGEGMRLNAAITEAGRRRLRPVLMTTLTTTFAMLPLALGIGEGADQQAPMARAVIGGLLSASFTTLLVIPVIYAIFHRRDDELEAETAVTPS
ncbi:HAE1 family hydrophobic/amphiphilic exporter-1 [Natronospira proteinivora]|uniref:HAE1 family hydrophobic/amphiphilic exporter-1 n=1 Tax=Natronospira proteinivora TaxID=1807133 RepID=A0ABT1G6G2_9GAMM|nr:efflux RND transporter permease subunit [Natronospira proteinivora]MCP1726885.1 HAE1 family hydrophobic/amphiphilic exporter-1 [Natronospira proteinivora]